MSPPKFSHIIFALMAVITLVAGSNLDDNFVYYIYSTFSIIALRSISSKNHSWFYTYMVIFFVLGNWLKVSIHHIFEYPYIEPIGSFSGSPSEWLDYYIYALFMLFGLVAGKQIFKFIDRSKTLRRLTKKSKLTTSTLQAPPVKGKTWAKIICIAFAIYLINSIFLFFVTGVNTKLALPFGLNAPIAFYALIGFSLTYSVFISRDVIARNSLEIRATLTILIISFVASISMASRAAIVMQAVPILVAAIREQQRIGKYSVSVKPFFLFGLFMIAVLVTVSIYRISVFSGGGIGDTELVVIFAIESALLIVDRWVGAEAIMASVAEPSRSISTFFDLITESPTIGVEGIYQSLSGSTYTALDGLTFLSLPGYFGIIGLSGSPVVAFICPVIITIFGIAIERLISSTIYKQEIVVSLASAAMANSFTQMSFPRLIIPFFIQLIILIFIIRYCMKRYFDFHIVHPPARESRLAVHK